VTSVEQSAGVVVTRLGIDDVAVAMRMFALMTDVFENPGEALTET
jgi:hypothetical protein